MGKNVPYRVENIVRKGEIACYKQFLLFSQWFLQLYIFSALKCSILDLSKLKAFADDKSIETQNLKFILGREENIVGKRENAGNQHFLFSYNVFKSFPPHGS